MSPLGRVLLASTGQRPGMLLNTLQWTGWPCKRVIRVQISLGHRFATMRSAQRAGFETFPAKVAAPPRDASLSYVFGTPAARRCRRRPSGVDQYAGESIPRCPFADPSARITTWTSVSLVPRNADQGLGRSPGLGRLGSFSRPRPPSPLSAQGRLFSPRRGPAAALPAQRP